MKRNETKQKETKETAGEKRDGERANECSAPVLAFEISFPIEFVSSIIIMDAVVRIQWQFSAPFSHTGNVHDVHCAHSDAPGRRR